MNGTSLILEELCEAVDCFTAEEEGEAFTTEIPTVPDNGLIRELTVTTQKLNELREEINGQTLNITFMEDFPLSYSVNENGTTRGMGVAFELLKFLTEKFNFTYELVKPQRNILGSSDPAYYNGSILQLLESETVQVAASFLPIMTEPQKHIFYSATTLDEGEWLMMMTRPEESASGNGLLAPFNYQVWILILVSLVFVGPIIYLLIVIRNKMTSDREQKMYTMPHCVWFVYGALMRQGSVLSPTGDSTRLIFATWWIFITILTSFYTANLTAFLTLSQFTLPINNVDDILQKQKRFVAHEGSAVEYSIKNNNESLVKLSKMVDKNLAAFVATLNDTEVLHNYVERQNYLFIRDKPAIKHLIYQDYKYRKTLNEDNEKIHCAFALAKEAFLKLRRTFAYSKTFRFQQLFDYELLFLVESGIVKYKLLENLPRPEICPNNLAGTDRQLRNGDLMMTYYVMIAGFCTSISVFVSEMFFKYLNYRQSKKVHMLDKSYGREQKSTTTQNVTTISPPPPYGTLFNRNRFNSHNSDQFTTEKSQDASRRIINGRDYMVIKEQHGGSRLIPIRTPSAALFQYSYTN